MQRSFGVGHMVPMTAHVPHSRLLTGLPWTSVHVAGEQLSQVVQLVAPAAL
jgi:hypothetical protein